MSSFSSITVISGYDTLDPGPPVGLERLKWSKIHHRMLHKRGHWTSDASLRAARKAGVVGDVKVEHQTLDLNGKGRGGIDRRFSVNEAGVTGVKIPADENKAWSDMQTADVWEDR
jgi:hypothetical protein